MLPVRMIVLFCAVKAVITKTSVCYPKRQQFGCTQKVGQDIKWFVDGQLITGNDDKISIETVSSTWPPKSILTVTNASVEDEKVYTCSQNGTAKEQYTLYVPPPTHHKEDNITIVFDGSPFNVNCADILGKNSKNCSYVQLYSNQLEDNNVDWQLAGDSFNISNPNGQQSLQCRVFHDGSKCSCPFDTIDGPFYQILYPPVISISGDNVNDTVPEGTPVSFKCSVINQNANIEPNYTIHWTVRDTQTGELYEGDIKKDVLRLNATSNVEITCTGTGSALGNTLESSATTALNTAPSLSKEDILISFEDCINVTILANTSSRIFPTDVHVTMQPNGQTVVIKKGSSAQTVSLRGDQQDQEVVLRIFSVVDGIEGNVYMTRLSTTCNSSVMTISLTECSSNELTESKVEDKIIKLLDRVHESCTLEICPQFYEHNWHIESIIDCTVIVKFDGIPVDLLLSALQDVCHESPECLAVEPTNITSATPTTTPPSTTDDNPSSPSFMPDWMFIGICVSFPTLCILACILLTCILFKLRKWYKKANRRSNSEPDPEEGREQQSNSTVNKDLPSHTTTIGETSSTASTNTRHSSMVQSASISNHHTKLPDHDLHSLVTVFSIPTPMLPLFTELGARESEQRTQMSADTGLGSIEHHHSVSGTSLTTRNSSGYGGGSQNATMSRGLADSHLLNPHAWKNSHQTQLNTGTPGTYNNSIRVNTQETGTYV